MQVWLTFFHLLMEFKLFMVLQVWTMFDGYRDSHVIEGKYNHIPGVSMDTTFCQECLSTAILEMELDMKLSCQQGK